MTRPTSSGPRFSITGAKASPLRPSSPRTPSGRSSIRGGVYVAYEMNIYNNLLFDQFALIPSGIGPDFYTSAYVGRPDGTPITPQVAGVTSLPAPCQIADPKSGPNVGDWSCLTDPSLTIGQ